MLTSLKIELKTWFYIRLFLLTILFILGSFIMVPLFSISALKTEYDSFKQSRQFIADDERLEQILQKPLYDGEGEVNSLLLKKMKVEDIINSLAPMNAFMLCIEFGYYLLPLIMTAIGAVTICRENFPNVSRIRMSREGKWRYLLVKQVVMLTLTISIIFVSVVLYLPVSHIVFSQAIKMVDTNLISISTARYADFRTVILQTLFLIVCVIIFLEIGFSLGYIAKTPVVPVSITVFFWFFDIISTGYEPKNAIYTIATRLIAFYGAVPNGVTTPISLTAAILIVFLMFLIPTGLFLFLWNKNSAFN